MRALRDVVNFSDALIQRVSHIQARLLSTRNRGRVRLAGSTRTGLVDCRGISGDEEERDALGNDKSSLEKQLSDGQAKSAFDAQYAAQSDAEEKELEDKLKRSADALG